MTCNLIDLTNPQVFVKKHLTHSPEAALQVHVLVGLNVYVHVNTGEYR